ncbi:methylthioribulose 1-phosphate dehydratase [Naasia aerilata]|uniref:Methylthioribulose-1-phosphate dehydratase n=1 Tax=Naasia aerilata TaxID=1162966 RepID=A0ABM8GCN9_9MICO|nr:methylthioribulose 1-phosphate dehydratase [Naasia aerilata]BDZ46017.1 methylthioribulose-1-phosphate dehydratase [Naasia aerilata]
MTSDEQLREAGTLLAAEAERFAAMGWMRGTSGNLSLTLSRDPLRLAVTASGLDKGELGPDDVVLVDGRGELLPGDLRGLVPSAEAGLHARIAAVTGAGAAVHVHAMAAVEAGFHWPDGVVLQDLEMLKGIGHSAHGERVVIPVVQNSQDMAELGDRFEELYVRPADGIAEVPGLIVASHGIYAWGATQEDARRHTEILEWLLRFTVRTRAPR